MTLKLFVEAIFKFLLGLFLVGSLIFIPAGTLSFYNGWLFIGVLFIPMFFTGIIMIFKNPELLRKRLDVKEKEHEQSLVVKLSGLMFIAGFIVAGLGYKHNWYILPKSVSVSATFVFLLAYILYAEVLRENTYLSRTIKVEENQKVIDKGLYGIVRHPMYSVTLLLFLSIPIVLGSVYSFIIFLSYPFIIAKRIKNPVIIDYKDIPNFLVSTVESHEGRLIYGKLGGKKVICMSGRFHHYEGYPFEMLTLPIRLFKLLGVKKTIVTNAAGAVNTEYNVGDIMIIKDHLKLTGASPLQGDNIEEFGPRFFDTTDII